MTRTQDSTRIITALENIISVIESGRPLARVVRMSQYLIDFPIDSAVLQPEHVAFLQQMHETMLADDTVTVVSVIGRASQTGPEGNNESLAFDRAETVRSSLTSGLPASRVGSTVAAGSSQPIVNVPGREAEMNRSVELIIEWNVEKREEPPPAVSGSRFWQLDLAVTAQVGIKVIGGRTDLGRLVKLDESGAEIDSRNVIAEMVGIDYGISIGVDNVSYSNSLGVADDGKMTFDTPVDFNWFDERNFHIASVGGGTAGGVSFTYLEFWPGGDFQATLIHTTYLDFDVQWAVTAGVAVMVGELKVADP